MQDMQKLFEIPQPVVDRILELKELVEKNPIYISPTDAAKFLRIAPESIRTVLEENPMFGVKWKKEGKANRAFCIPSATFYLWYMNMSGAYQYVARQRDKK